MINYDIPWNPNRLDQRMGRIHRIGQKLDVHVFNFVAHNTVEGQILQRLLEKLDEIRSALGGRVFDVIGLLLQLNDVRLEEMLREAAYNPTRLADYMDQIERISPEKLKQFEQATGVAMATSSVDLSRVREQDFRSEERRLMPEYVEKFFLQAAEVAKLRVEPRADALWRVGHVPGRLRATTLHSVKRYGPPKVEYRKLTSHKEHLKETRHLDAELLSPGHPLFRAVTEVMENSLAESRQASAAFVDPTASAPYRLHFFEVRLLGERPGNGHGPSGSLEAYAALVAVLEDEDGKLELAPPDVLHDLTPAPADVAAPGSPPTAEGLQHVDRWVKAHLQHPLTQERRAEREREVDIRRDYLRRSFDASIAAARKKWSDLAARVASGEERAKLARDEALRRVSELEVRRETKMAELELLRIIRPGPVTYVGTALVSPVAEAEIAELMRRDEEVERIAMEVVIEHERARRWEPTDVSALRDGSGFDIRSLGPQDEYGQREVRRIEVKGRGAPQGDVVLTPNEWLQARRHGDTYWLYVVWNCRGEVPVLRTIQNPAQALFRHAEELTVVKGYRIPSAAIDSAT